MLRVAIVQQSEASNAVKSHATRGTMKSQTPVSQLSDQDLLAAVKVAAGHERDATARLVALLAQLDERRLYLGEGCSSLFTYCTQVLHLSEHAAYGRIEAARAARRFPIVLDLPTDGSVTLTAVTLLAPHLTTANHCDVLSEALHKSKREIEHLVARLQPRTPVPPTIRKLPAPKLDESSVRPVRPDPIAQTEAAVVLSSPPRPRPAIVTPLAPERYKVQFAVSAETHDKLRRAQDLLRHVIPNADWRYAASVATPAEICGSTCQTLEESQRSDCWTRQQTFT